MPKSVQLRLALTGVVATLVAPTSSRALHSPPPPSASEQSLGVVHFPISCADGVRGDFERAVALLHHMTYRQARLGFEGVSRRDPGCAMAYWGVAMTWFQPLWPNRPGPEELRRGFDAVGAAESVPPPSERERLYIAAAAEFFRDPASPDYWERIRRWERGQDALYQAFPDDLDAAAFFALAHLASAPLADRPLDHHERAAEILLGIHRREPRHPGAVHYLIHANDIVGREGESLEIVRSYREIAPHNPHALHMPTHIFVRLGSWQEAIEWNREAARAALDTPAGETGDLVSDELPHALEYLVYAALQEGDVATAVQAGESLLQAGRLEPSFKTAFHLASIPARIALERHAWSEAAALQPRQPAFVDWDRFPWPEAITWFARGLGCASLGKWPEAREAETAVASLRDKARQAGEEPFAREIEVLRLELSAWIARSTDPSAALASLRAAADLQQATPKQPVTPAPTLPPQELLADLLLELGRPEEALAAYELSLQATPGRRNSLEGARRASQALASERTEGGD